MWFLASLQINNLRAPRVISLVKALLWPGLPRRLLDLARHRVITLCTSPVLLAELAEVIARDKLVSRDKDLLTLHPYHGIPIVLAADALQRLEPKATE